MYEVLCCMRLYVVVWGSKNNTKWVGLPKFHKRRNFFSVLKKLSAIWSNLTLHHLSLSLSFSLAKYRICMSTYVKKIFLICFSPLFPQAEQKEDDEHFASHLQIYLSRTFTKTRKFLKIEEVEYLIHYAKFKV